MPSGTTTITVRVRQGLLGLLAIAMARYTPRLVSMRFVVWCINHSSYMSVGRGRWKKFNPGLSVEVHNDPRR